VRTAYGRLATAGRRLGALALAAAAASLAPPIRAPPAGALATSPFAASAPTVSAATGLPGGRTPTPPAGAAAALQRLHFGVRLVDVPVDEAHNPRALHYIIDFLPTGSVIHRRILIINDEPTMAHLTVYPGAAQVSGGLFVGGSGHPRNELTGWITVQHPAVTLPPGQSSVDLVTIRVPRNATRAEHYAVIWAEQDGITRSGGNNIKVVAKVGIRVYLAVGPGGAPPTRFTITSLTVARAASGQPLLLTHVRDTGGRAADLAGQVRLADGPGGTSAGPFAARRTVTLAPGQSGYVVFALPASLPAGAWVATVTLSSGITTITARSTAVIGAQAAAASWASPVSLAWSGGMLLGLAVIAAVLIARFWRPRRSPA
jgi:hypothetical protein